MTEIMSNSFHIAFSAVAFVVCSTTLYYRKIHRYDDAIALRMEGGLFSVDIVLYAPQDAEA